MKKILLILTTSLLAFSAMSMPKIHSYAKDGRLDDVKALLKKDPSILDSRDESGKTPLLWATITGRDEVIDYLIEQGACLTATNKYGSGVLHYAAEENHPQLLTKFLEHGLDINSGNKDGETPLHEAARCGNIEAIKVLLKAGATVNQKNRFGHTPMDKAYLSREAFETKEDAFSKKEVRMLDEAITLLRSAGGIAERKR